MTKRWINRPDGSNWGDFGPDDQIGRINLLTPERRLAAAREIVEGLTFCLSLPLDYPGGNELFPLRKAPTFRHERRGEGHNFNYRLSAVCRCFTDVVSDDAVLLYTQYSTQWDALAHCRPEFDADGDGTAEVVFYNGYRGGRDIASPDAAEAHGGAGALGIENLARAGVQGRGVLLDLSAALRPQARPRGLRGADAPQEQQWSRWRPGTSCACTPASRTSCCRCAGSPTPRVLHVAAPGWMGGMRGCSAGSPTVGVVALCADNAAVEATGDMAGGGGDRHPLCRCTSCACSSSASTSAELWYFGALARLARRAPAQPLPPDRAAAGSAGRGRLAGHAARDRLARARSSRRADFGRPAGVIRHYDLFASGVRAHNIERARHLLAAPERSCAEADSEAETPSPAHRCPCCGGRMIIVETFEGARPARSPSPSRIRIDTS